MSIALLAKRCESLRPWRFPKAEPLAAGVKGAFRNAPLPRAGRHPQKRNEFYFIKSFWGVGQSPTIKNKPDNNIGVRGTPAFKKGDFLWYIFL